VSAASAQTVPNPAAGRWRLVGGLRRFVPGLTWSDTSRNRLDVEIAIFRGRLDERRRRHEGAQWVDEVEGLLARAESSGWDVDGGWAYFNAAVRASVPGFTDADRVAERIALRNEAEAKLTGWRRATVRDLLERRGEDDEILQKAMQIRDDSGGNEFRKLSLARSQIAVASVELLLALAAALALELAAPVSLKDDPADAPHRIWALVFLFGVIGGCISVIQQRRVWARVPEMVGDALITATRPLSGGAAALVSYPLIASGVLAGAKVDSVAAVLGVAFAAGFSERWVVRAAASLGGGDSKATSRDARESPP